MTGAWQPTGHMVEVDRQFDRIPPFDERSGDHLWMVVAGFQVNPEGWNGSHTPMLDQENLLTIQGPGCFHCEQPYTSLLAKRRCKGRP